jgi:hypothetical protein
MLERPLAATSIVLLCALYLAPLTGAAAQRADSARIGAYQDQHVLNSIAPATESNAELATHPDTGIIAVAHPSHIAKYMAIGAATGVVAGVVAVAYELRACNGKSTNGIPACLGMDAAAYLTLFTGVLVGSVVGTLAGKAADARER